MKDSKAEEARETIRDRRGKACSGRWGQTGRHKQVLEGGTGRSLQAGPGRSRQAGKQVLAGRASRFREMGADRWSQADPGRRSRQVPAGSAGGQAGRRGRDRQVPACRTGRS
jgi:hypothetical protein